MREVRDETALWQLHQSEREERGGEEEERRRKRNRAGKAANNRSSEPTLGCFILFLLFLLFYFLSITQFDPFRFCLHLQWCKFWYRSDTKQIQGQYFRDQYQYGYF